MNTLSKSCFAMISLLWSHFIYLVNFYLIFVKDNFRDGFSNRESKIIDIVFVSTTSTMDAYDDSFDNFFRSHSDIQAGQRVSADIHPLSSQVPSGIDAMNINKSIALHKIEIIFLFFFHRRILIIWTIKWSIKVNL